MHKLPLFLKKFCIWMCLCWQLCILDATPFLTFIEEINHFLKFAFGISFEFLLCTSLDIFFWKFFFKKYFSKKISEKDFDKNFWKKYFQIKFLKKNFQKNFSEKNFEKTFWKNSKKLLQNKIFKKIFYEK